MLIFVYVDGCTLRPTHVSSRQITFAEPVSLKSSRAIVETVVGERRHAREVYILAHAEGSRRIPIELIEESSAARQLA